MLERAFVSSLALDKSELRLTVVGVPDRPGTAAAVLSALAAADVPVAMIIQSAPSLGGVNDISFMSPRGYAAKAKKALEAAARRLGAKRVDLNEQVAKISAIGTGFRHSPKIAAAMFSALAAQKINIHMISASDLRISCVVDLAQGEAALKALHKAYGLAKAKRR